MNKESWYYFYFYFKNIHVNIINKYFFFVTNNKTIYAYSENTDCLINYKTTLGDLSS